jgi:hypothetical protein
MTILILVLLLVLGVGLTLIGFLVKTLFWVAIFGIGLFIATSIVAAARQLRRDDCGR